MASKKSRGFGAPPPQADRLRTSLRQAEAHLRAGRLVEAGDLYHFILQKLDPDCPEALRGMGTILMQMGKDEGALHLLSRAAELRPDWLDVAVRLGTVLLQFANFDQAEAEFRRALALSPESAAAHNGLGRVYQALDRWGEAEQYYRQALALAPSWSEPAYHLGWILFNTGRLPEAETCYRRVLAEKPDLAGAHTCLGLVLQGRGKLDQSLDHLRRALALQPDAATHTCLLLALQYRDDLDPATWQTALEAFGHFCASRPLAPPRAVAPVHRLRIGYVSPDFRTHSCAWFIEPLLASHNRDQFEIFCYADVRVPDKVTARLQALAEHWQPVAGWPDSEVQALIQADQIDILIDLAGHTSANRLTLFASKPAPIQVSWLGFPGSTGLSAVDYRLSDPWLTPKETPEYFAETVWNLERPAHCYRPPAAGPAVSPLPALKQGVLSFGSFNKLSKISPQTVALWSAVLRAIPASRLVLKSLHLGDPDTRTRLIQQFEDHGVSSERLVVLETQPETRDHLACYHQVDIALDTFPYNGATTTLEALWMGVPVISRVGWRTASRYGLAFLSAVDLPSLAATTDANFVEQAVALSRDLKALSTLRAELRHRLKQSPVCDEKGFTQEIERAYQLMWQIACQAKSPN